MASQALIALSLILLLPLVVFCNVASSSSLTCPKYDAEEYLLLQRDYCIRDTEGNFVYDSIPSRVAEVNGTTLERALSILQTKDYSFAAVLFYADWCPFSRTFRPLLDTLSINFPTIYHIAVEDSAIQPSALSHHGVHSFPVLFLLNKTLKVRYYGPRTAAALAKFYKDITGIETTDKRQNDRSDLELFEKIPTERLVQGKVKCPYPWAKSPEKWLHDDTYLLLSVAFLALRVLAYLIPKLLRRLKNFWVQNESSLEAHRVLLRRMLLRDHPDTAMSISTKSNADHERLRKGKGVLSVHTWPPPPLAVALAESSSRRSAGMEDARENGQACRNPAARFWG